MSIDMEAPRSRRAIIAGAIGGLLTAFGVSAKPSEVRAADGGNMILGATNTTTSKTEIDATTTSPGLKVLATDVALQGWGNIGVDAYGTTIGLNAVGDGTSAPAVVGYNRANSTGVLGWSTDGNESTPSVPGRTGVYGLAEQVQEEGDPIARGVFGKSISGIGVAAESTSGPAIDARSEESAGVIGVGPFGFVLQPLAVKPGVYGSAALEPGVYGFSTEGYGLRGDSQGGDGVYGLQTPLATGVDPHVDHGPGAGVHGHGGQAGVLGTNAGGFGVQATSDSAPALFASNSSASAAAIVAEGGTGTAIHGHANPGGADQIDIPDSPPLTGLYGSAFLAGTAIAADSASGLALRATSSAGHAVRGRGQLDGVIGESATDRSGVVGFSGAGAAPAGPAKTGVYGEATQDATSRGVRGISLAGQGVRGEATTGQGVQGIATTGQAVRGDTTGGTAVHGQSTSGTGVKAVATTGFALDVAGRATFSRSGKALIPANQAYVDVIPPGGLSGTPLVFALIQYGQAGVWVTGARPGWPSASKIRIYLNKVASTTSTTPVAWFIAG
ncbi:MAG TPA: hypothetical protein VIF63_05190 [Candidatus Limnocylindrales bacterium]